MRTLVIGHSSYDISCPVDEYPIENTKYRLNSSVMCGGGPAGNAAYLLGKWGIETFYAGVVGSDDFGAKIKKEFESVGVNTQFLETNYEKPTSISFVMINKQNGSRTLFNISGERANMKRHDFMMDPEIILIDGHEYNASMYALNKYPNSISIIDAGRITPELLDLCKYCKYIVASKGFAETVSKIKIDFANPDTLVQVYTVLKNKYPKSEIVVTLEEKGALYAVDGQIKVMPGLKVSPVDTTGAGDIFHGAFTYGIAKGYDLEKVIRYANITAGLSIQKMGARVSIPSISEVTNYYNEKFPVNNTPSAQNATQTPVQQDNANNNAVQAPQISTIPVVPQNPTPAEFNQPSVANMPINTAPSMEVQNNFNNPNPNLNQNVAGSPMTYEQATLYNQQNNGNLNG